MFTFPPTETFPEVDVRYPPANVKSPVTLSGYVPFAKPPDGIVSEATVNGDARETLPATMRAANA